MDSDKPLGKTYCP